MRWILSKDEKPLYENRKGDSEKAEVECLCKKRNVNQLSIMTYVLNKHCWVDYDTSSNIPYNEVEKWVLLSDVDDLLEEKPEPEWCWEFGWSLANKAIPALEHWIEHGVSYKYGMTPEEWQNVLTKIKKAFEVSLNDLDDSIYNSNSAERESILNEHDKIRKEGFELLSKYYLDMWD